MASLAVPARGVAWSALTCARGHLWAFWTRQQLVERQVRQRSLHLSTRDLLFGCEDMPGSQLTSVAVAKKLPKLQGRSV